MERKALATELEHRWGTRIPFNQEVLIDNKTFGVIRDMSISGCFIDSKVIFGLGQQISLRFNLSIPEAVTLMISGRIVNIRPGAGFGIKFNYETQEQPEIVRKFIAHVLNSNSSGLLNK